MKSGGDPHWYEFAASVPLTGREPLVGRLRSRLRTRGPGWGWITLQGAPGSGVTRMLDEAHALLEERGEPAALRIRPRVDDPTPLAALRHALVPCFPRMTTPQALERTLRLTFSGGPDEVSALTAWLVGGEGAARMARPSQQTLHKFLCHLVRGGPLLIDDHELLDPATRAVVDSMMHVEGPGVIAGTHLAVEDALGPEVWSLEALSAGQTELMLRRWLRHPATAKRLTGVFHETLGGLPGRIVQGVRALGRDEFLVKAPRGIVLKSTPAVWPDGRVEPSAFRRMAAKSATARRILEISAVLDGHEPSALVAESAGVKRSIVDAWRREAAASRGGALPGSFFGSAEARTRYRAVMTQSRIDDAHARIAAAATKLANRRKLALPALIAGLHNHAIGACDAAALGAALTSVLRQAPPAYQVQSWAVDLIDKVLRILARAPLAHSQPVARGVAFLEAVGRQEAALAHVGAVSLDVAPTDYWGLWLCARAHMLRNDAAAAEACLAEGLHAMAGRADASARPAFEAWLLHARLGLARNDYAAARESGRRAGAYLGGAGLACQAKWHDLLGACADGQRRSGAAAAHWRRAVRLLRALNHLRPAGIALLRLGQSEVQHGRAYQGISTLARAAHVACVVDDASSEAEARFEMGRTYASCEAYDSATEHLECALRVVDRHGLEPMRLPLHLALARAYRGRGDLVNERRHANRAVQYAGAALMRLRAAAVLAEADLRAGAPGAERLLERTEQDLRAAGMHDDAELARALLSDLRLKNGEAQTARATLGEDPRLPVARLTRARLALAMGREAEAVGALERLAAEPGLAAHVRAAAYTHLADARCLMGDFRAARPAAVAGAALLEVTHRSRANDARLHVMLARVFLKIGDSGRAAGHRSLARRGMRRLIRAASDPMEGRRLVRTHWRADPRPRRGRELVPQSAIA